MNHFYHVHSAVSHNTYVNSVDSFVTMHSNDVSIDCFPLF